MNEIFVWITTVISASGGAIVYALWNKWREDTEQAQRDKENSLKERIDIIGGEVKARLQSVEHRVGSLEKVVDDFKRETGFALRSQREHNEKILEGVRSVIGKADNVQKEFGKRVDVVEDKLETFIGWLKSNGR